MDLRDVVLDGRRREIGGPNDPWCGGNHLFGGEETTSNQGADHRVTDVEPVGGLLEGAPAVACGTGRIEDRNLSMQMRRSSETFTKECGRSRSDLPRG
jgi:hypothetical protein